MKKLFTIISCLSIGFCSIAQLDMSPKLGQNDGIPGINITKEYPATINGLTKLPTNEKPWSTLVNDYYTRDKVQLGDPKKLNYTNVYGLKVERIEVICSTEENVTYIHGISVFLKLPETEAELEKFYTDFTEAYDPMLDVIGFSEAGYELLEWHSTNECGAMMSIPAWLALSNFKELGLQHLEICFSPSCGG